MKTIKRERREKKTIFRMKTNKEKFNIKYGQDSQASNSISKIVKLSGISKSILEEVGQRGRNAHANNPQSVRLKSGKNY